MTAVEHLTKQLGGQTVGYIEVVAGPLKDVARQVLARQPDHAKAKDYAGCTAGDLEKAFVEATGVRALLDALAPAPEPPA